MKTHMNIYKLSIVSAKDIGDVFVVAGTLADAIAGYCEHHEGVDVRAGVLVGECAGIVDFDEDEWGAPSDEGGGVC